MFLAGLFGINHAVDHNVTGPTVVEKNCTHATFSFEVQYVEFPIRRNGAFYIYRSDGDGVRIIFVFCTIFKKTIALPHSKWFLILISNRNSKLFFHGVKIS